MIFPAHEPLDQAPRFFVEPNDTDAASEVARAVAIRVVLQRACPRLRVVAVPNAAKRGPRAARQVKLEGLVRGWPDLLVLMPASDSESKRVAFLEVKTGRGRLSRHQIEQCNWLHDHGFSVACVRTANGALAFLRAQGWPL